MAPSQINTAAPAMPFPRRRTSSETSSPTSSTASSSSMSSSPTSPTHAHSHSMSGDAGNGLFARIRSARSRSPGRRNTVGTPASPGAMPASPMSPRTPARSHTTGDIRPRPAKRNSGTTMQCGRHSNDWLFGGFSMRDTVRDFLHRGDEETKQ